MIFLLDFQWKFSRRGNDFHVVRDLSITVSIWLLKSMDMVLAELKFVNRIQLNVFSLKFTHRKEELEKICNDPDVLIDRILKMRAVDLRIILMFLIVLMYPMERWNSLTEYNINKRSLKLHRVWLLLYVVWLIDYKITRWSKEIYRRKWRNC